jgi:hypothetical protein
LGVSAAVFCFFFQKKEDRGISVVFGSFSEKEYSLREGVVKNETFKYIC